MNRMLVTIGFVMLLPVVLPAQPAGVDSTVNISFGGFVDMYYAHDFGRPENMDRSYTTQPARHGEFNVNLAFIEAAVSGPRVRGRLALQAGTSVQSNYGGEPAIGSVSGPDLSRFLQEAYVGFRVAPRLWIDGGIFFSNTGTESWISSQNPTYSRSLVGEYSPYYSAGVRAIWQATPSLAARLDVVNGWQNISESNSDKSVAARLDWMPAPGATLSYYNFAGNEAGGRLRLFNGVGAALLLSEQARVLVQADVGLQERTGNPSGNPSGDWSTWYGFTLVGHYQLTSTVAIAARMERFDDEDEVLIATADGLPGFRANSASLGVDVTPAHGFTWRTELRGFRGDAAIFPDRDAARGLARHNAFLVSSFAFGF